MIKLLIAIFFAAMLCCKADTQPRGPDRLRELVIFPTMDLTFSFAMRLQGNDWMVEADTDSSEEIDRLREELKKRPENVRQLLRLGFLYSSDQTNESQTCYEKAEQLCRGKLAVNPQDGLNLTGLGAALSGLGHHDEADSIYRQATLVSSNSWSCWVKRGNFLADGFILLFPVKLRPKLSYSYQSPSQEVLDYWPSAEALKGAENSLAEASQCFDRAMAIAPAESEVFFQYAGYLSVSNWQNCFFRRYRNYEKISSQKWILAFLSPETITNLKKAAELKPKDYLYTSLAAYFEYSAVAIEARSTNFTADMLPDKTKQFIRSAMTRLEDLSEDSDKKKRPELWKNLDF